WRNTFASVFRSGRPRRIPVANAISCGVLVRVPFCCTGGGNSLEDAKLGDICRCSDVCPIGADRAARPAGMGECAFLDRPLDGNVWSGGGRVVSRQPPTTARGGTGVSRSTRAAL